MLISNQAGAQGIQLLSIDGDATGDNFGSSVSNAGDVNNDGYDDLILGAPELDQIFPFGIGYARVISGLDGSVIHDFGGLKYLSAYGLSVSGAGDIDGDGYDEIVVSFAAPFADEVLILDDITHGFEPMLSPHLSNGFIVHEYDAGTANFAGDVLPMIVDVDDDGISEIVIVYGTEGGSSLMIFDDATGEFARTH